MIIAPDPTHADAGADGLGGDDVLRARHHDRVLARSLGDAVAEAEALGEIAALVLADGHLDDALTAAIEARELARLSGSEAVEVHALHLEGRIHAAVGNLDDALDNVLTALDLVRRSDESSTRGVDERALLSTLAAVHLERGDVDRALTVAEAAVAAGAELPRNEAEVVALACLAEVRAAAGDLGPAAGSGEAALALAREVAPSRVPELLVIIASIDVGLHRWDRALRRVDEAAGLVDDERPVSLLLAADLALVRAAVAAGCGDHHAALGFDGDAIALARRVIESDASEVLQAAALRRRLRAHRESATRCRALGLLDQAVVHLEQRVTAVEALGAITAEQRMRTQQIAHDAEAGRLQAEILRLRTGELEALVRGRTYDLEEYQLEAFQRLAVLAEFRDTDTGEHTIRVGDLAGEIADELGEASPWSHRLRLAARLHDIGKVAVPDAILLKPGKLTDDEMAVMRTHTTVGAEILGGSVSPLIQLAAEVALNHHEWWDGRGYPNGAAGEAIPLSGRIVGVADVFDALLSARPYKRAWTTAEAAQYIIDGCGAQFEPRIVDAFLRVALRRHPDLAGHLTRLA